MDLHNDWYLMESWPGLMLTAKFEIVARKTEFLLPMTWRRERVGGREKPVPETRLPGNYAFVSLARDASDPDFLNDQAATLVSLRGVRQIYKSADHRYLPVPAWEIHDLKKADAEEHREASRAKPKVTESRFKKDQKVRILRNGLWEGLIGTFLYSTAGQARLAMENGITKEIPDCDLIEAVISMKRAV